MVQLLIATCQSQGCLCNPATNASGLQHICVSLRQLGMMAMKLAIPLYLPWKFDSTAVMTLLQNVSEQPALSKIHDSLMTRDFAPLWTDPLVTQLLRSRCLVCGCSMHPAELRAHAANVHSLAHLSLEQLMPQLLQAFQRDSTMDYQCDACGQIFNHPATGPVSKQEQDTRTLLAQIHFQHQCPVLYQVAALFLHGHGHTQPTQHRGLGNVGDIPTPEPPPGDGKVRAVRRRQRRQESKERQGEGQGETIRTRRRHNAVVEGDGPSLTSSGCRATSAQASRLMDLLHANRATGTTPVADSEGGRMATELQQEGGEIPRPDNTATPMSSDTTHGRGLPVQASSAGRKPGDRSAEGDSSEAGPADPGQPLPLPEMESNTAEPSNHSISLHRMIKYGKQLQDILKDPSNTIRFHSLKPMAEEAVIPWMWQISMRADDLQVLLTTLQGSTAWGLLGMSLKPHSQGQSRPAQHLQELMGKGVGKTKGRSKGKTMKQ